MNVAEQSVKIILKGGKYFLTSLVFDLHSGFLLLLVLVVLFCFVFSNI